MYVAARSKTPLHAQRSGGSSMLRQCLSTRSGTRGPRVHGTGLAHTVPASRACYDLACTFPGQPRAHVPTSRTCSCTIPTSCTRSPLVPTLCTPRPPLVLIVYVRRPLVRHHTSTVLLRQYLLCGFCVFSSACICVVSSLLHGV